MHVQLGKEDSFIKVKIKKRKSKNKPFSGILQSFNKQSNYSHQYPKWYSKIFVWWFHAKHIQLWVKSYSIAFKVSIWAIALLSFVLVEDL